MKILQEVESKFLKKNITNFSVGDSVCIHTRVIEEDKERIQKYSGIVIARKGIGINASVTIRRISFGEGVERLFPIHSPLVAKIEVERIGMVRRAKLNFLRNRKGKAAMSVKERKFVKK